MHSIFLFGHSGESYGGDYVPQLVYEVVTGSDAQIKKNLKGFMVGNPVFSCQSWKQYGNTVQVELYYWHGNVIFSLLLFISERHELWACWFTCLSVVCNQRFAVQAAC
jgi:hypothetical protein